MARRHLVLVGLLILGLTTEGIQFPEDKNALNNDSSLNNKKLLIDEYKCSDYDFKFNEAGAGVISVLRNASSTDIDCAAGLVQSCEEIEEEVCEPVKSSCKQVEEEGCVTEEVEECSEEVEKTCHPAGNETKIGAVCVEEVVTQCKTVPKEICQPTLKEVCDGEGSEESGEVVCHTHTSKTCKDICQQQPAHKKATKGADDSTPSDYQAEDLLHDPSFSVSEAWAKISPNLLFFPWIQWYRAPNVVREDAMTDSAQNEDDTVLLAADTESRELQMLGESDDIFAQVSKINRTYLSLVPGCYPFVLPISSTFAAFFSSLVTTEGEQDSLGVLLAQGNSTYHIIQALRGYEPRLAAYWSLFANFNYIRGHIRESSLASATGGHVFSESDLSQVFGYLGSYLGLSFKKDFNIAQCEIQQSVSENWEAYQKQLKRIQKETAGKPFPLENITVEDIFFSYEGSSLTVGEYNISEVVEEYNISASAYSIGDSLFENFDPFYNFVSIYTTSVTRKLRSEMAEVESRQDVNPNIRTVQEKIMRVLQEKQVENFRKKARYLKAEHKEEAEAACEEIDSTNVQECYEVMIKEVFNEIEEDQIQTVMATVDITLLTYFAQMQMSVAIMLSLAASYLVSVKDILALSFPCLYDVIESDSILMDLPEVRENGTTFLQVFTKSLEREHFVKVHNIFIEKIPAILGDKDFFPGLANMTEAIIKKFGSVSSNETLAERVSYRLEDLREWFLGMDVPQVLQQFTELVKTVGSYCWSWYSGEWVELEALVVSLVEWVEGEVFWDRLHEVMLGVAQDRWGQYEAFVQVYFTPALVHTANYVNWLAGDVKGNLDAQVRMINDCEAVDYLWTYYGRVDTSVGEFFICREDFSTSDVSSIVSGVPAMLSYLEPGFAIFQHLPHLFDMGASTERGQLLASSGLREAVKDIQAKVIGLKQSLVCRPVQEGGLNEAYWEQVLV